MRHTERFTPAEVGRMIESGMRRSDIARYFAVSVPTLRRYMKLIGVEGKQIGGRKPFIRLCPDGRSHADKPEEP
jgi:DNA invertase Pin-like site-specific DNA recombinase